MWYQSTSGSGCATVATWKILSCALCAYYVVIQIHFLCLQYNQDDLNMVQVNNGKKHGHIKN